MSKLKKNRKHQVTDSSEPQNKTADWHKGLSDLQEKVLHMLDHSIHTDCTFVVGLKDENTQEFKAHRILLCTASEVFERMLMGEMKEALTGHVRITDITPYTFHLLLRYVYTNKVELATFQEAKNVALAAHKYQMHSLLETCLSRMRELMSPTHMWIALELAKLLEQNDLKEACIELMQLNTIQCITADSFLQTSEMNIALLLTQDVLNVENELVLIHAVVSWARCEAQRRGTAGDDAGVRAVLEPRLLSLLRFLTLTAEQFVFGPAFAEWLTSDEKRAISNYQHDKKITAVPKHLSNSLELRKNISLKYNRACIDTKQFFTMAHEHCDLDIYVPCLHVSGVFRVMENCKLLGLILPSQHDDDTTVLSQKLHVYYEAIDITVSECGTSLNLKNPCDKLCTKKYTQMTQYNSTISINFDEPVQLSTDKWYEIKIDVKVLDESNGKYPDVLMTKNGSSSGIEFIFHTEHLKGFRTSKNVNFIQSLILSPSKRSSFQIFFRTVCILFLLTAFILLANWLYNSVVGESVQKQFRNKNKNTFFFSF